MYFCTKNMNSKTENMLNRTFTFGVGTVKFLRKLPDDHIIGFKNIKLRDPRDLSAQIMRNRRGLFQKEILQIR
jgi:hypothetical protein